MLKKLVLSLFLAAGIAVALSGSAEAADLANGSTLRHAYRPYKTQTRAMRARVDNFVPQSVNKLVCVEAFKVSTGAKTHLGCLNIPLAAYNSSEEWAFEFDAPTYWLAPGTYRVVYTYRADDGSWHTIKSVNLTTMSGSYNAI